MIEKSNQMYGGTCINEGCIPSKSLIIQADKQSYGQAVERKEALIEKLRKKILQAGFSGAGRCHHGKGFLCQ